MPSARTHDTITIISGAIMTPITYYAALEYTQLGPSAALACSFWLGSAHLLSGIMFSSDLDIDSTIDNRWGIFFWIWRPYMWFIPHRSFWSHSLIISPLLRLGYFVIVVYGLLFVMSLGMSQIGLIPPAFHREFVEQIYTLIKTRPDEVGAFVIGFCTGSAAHTIADWLVTKGYWLLGRYGRRLRRRYRDHQ